MLPGGSYNAPVDDPIRIAGGGLSGLATAVLLAGRGRRAEVFDRRAGLGGRFAGGWQIIENGTRSEDALVELERLGYPAGVSAVPVTSATLLDGLGGVHEVASAVPYAYFVRRGGDDSLDAWLAAAARERGVEIHAGTAAPRDVDVVATGPSQADGVAREIVFASDLPDTVMVLFDPQVTPTGYAYLFCLSGHATFGVAQVRRVAGLAAARDRAWSVFRRRLGDFSVDSPREGGQFMNFSLPAGLEHGGRWLVGEAAGVQDFLFGLGNRLALRTAAVAAAALAGDDAPARVGRDVLAPMRASIGMRLVYERLGRRGFAALCRWLAGGDFRRRLLRLQRPDPAKAVLSAVARWAWKERRGCRHGPLCRWCRRAER